MQPSNVESTTHSNKVLGLLLISYAMIVIDNSVVITGLPSIKQQLAMSDSGLAWISSAYSLTFGGFLLLCARAGDLLGKKRVLITGLVIFIVSSLAIGMASQAEWLISARAVQGMGAAMLAPSTLSLLQHTFPSGKERTRAISLYAAAGGLSASIGLVVGGILAQTISWRAGFLINVPIGALVLLGVMKQVTETPRHQGTFDLLGAILSAFTMTGLVYGTITSVSIGWTAPQTLVCFALSAIMLIMLVIVERRAAQPIMPLSLFCHRQRSGAYLTRVLYIGAAMGYFFFTTQLMQNILHYSALQAGFAFLPAMLLNFIIAIKVPLITQRMGDRKLMLVSMVALLIGMFLLSRLGAQSTYFNDLLLPLLLVGAGIGGATGPLTRIGLRDVASEEAGAASGIINAAHQLGGALGISIMVAASAQHTSLSGVALAVAKNHWAFNGGTVLAALAIGVIIVTIRRE